MKIILLLLLLYSTQLSAQNVRINENSKFSLKIDPTAFIPLYSGPSLRIGAEYKIKENWSIFNEFGYYIPQKCEECLGRNGNGFTVKMELKNYFDKDVKTSGRYASAELFYKRHTYLASDSLETSSIFIKNYSVSKNVQAFTIKYGYLTVYKSGIIIDTYVGVGIRFKQTKNSLTKADNQKIASSSDYSINVFTNKAGNFIYPNFSLGVKIGFRIK